MTEKERGHIPVLAAEVIGMMDIRPNGTYLDMTVGGFGHGTLICEILSKDGTYIGLDMDADAIERVKHESRNYQNRFVFEKIHFARFAETLASHSIISLNGCLADLGVSSYQLDEAGRGFSFFKEAPLDMRMDSAASISAADIIAGYSEERLKQIFSEYGEERFSGTVARAIVRERKKRPITVTTQLADIIAGVIPKKYTKPNRHPATQCFLALRVETNREYERLAETLKNAVDWLAEDGVIAVISFNSVEDRIVKKAFAEKAKGCICPKDFPVCICKRKPEISLINKSPLIPGEGEIRANPRARSAKLRCARKLP